MPHIQNRFMELLERKRRRDGRPWTYRDIQEVTGINPTTLTRFAKQRHNQFDASTLAALCEFLGVGVGDLLVMREEDEEGQRVAVAAG